ncbi:hypothetical protein GBA52_015112, partial [Prunus armeniaca]
ALIADITKCGGVKQRNSQTKGAKELPKASYVRSRWASEKDRFGCKGQLESRVRSTGHMGRF